MSKESYKAPFRRAYHGRCLVVVRTTQQAGEILLTASSEGLQSATLKLITQ